MKAGWKTVKLGEACELLTGGTPSRQHPEYFGGDIRWLVSGDINQKQIHECEGRITALGLENSNARLLPKNSVMIALAGQGKTRGTVAMLRVEATCNQSMVCMAPKEREKLLPEFLYYNLQGRYQEIRRLTGDDGNDRRGLNMGIIYGIEIPLPPLAEQKRIVALLDEAFMGIDTAKANAEALRANAKELKASLLSRHLMPDEAATKAGWKIVKLDELIEVQNGYAFSSKDYSDSGHFLMRIGNVQNGQITTSDPRYVQLPPDGSLNRFTLVRGDILVSLTGNVGRVGVISDVHLPAALNQRVARITPRSHAPISREFLLHFLGSDSFREQLSDAGRGSAQQNVSTKDLIALEIPLPPLAEQKRIVALLDEAFMGIDHLDLNISNAIAGYFDLKASLLSQAFVGKLTA